MIDSWIHEFMICLQNIIQKLIIFSSLKSLYKFHHTFPEMYSEISINIYYEFIKESKYIEEGDRGDLLDSIEAHS